VAKTHNRYRTMARLSALRVFGVATAFMQAVYRYTQLQRATYPVNFGEPRHGEVAEIVIAEVQLLRMPKRRSSQNSFKANFAEYLF
jgi:hypothetical protein